MTKPKAVPRARYTLELKQEAETYGRNIWGLTPIIRPVGSSSRLLISSFKMES